MTGVLVLLLLAAAPKDEASERFSRGVKLYSNGDKAAALSEFLRVYELQPKPTVLYNLGLTWAALDAPVKAVEALDRVLAAPGSVSKDHLERAKRVRDEQAARLGEVVIDSPIEGASVELNNETVGVTPLRAPVRVRSGKTLVSATAPKYAPRRLEVDVPAGGRTTVTLTLTQAEKPVAQLRIKSKTPGAEVLIDGERAGTTPLSTTVPVTPGERHIVLTRDAYQPRERAITLSEGSLGELSVDLEEDKDAVARTGATLELSFSETQAVVGIDGSEPRKYEGALLLAPGPHLLHVERDGFFTIERELKLLPRSRTSTQIVFEPTAETLAGIESSYGQHRLLGFAGLIGGGAVFIGGLVYLIYNFTQIAIIDDQIRMLSDGRHQADFIDAEQRRGEAGALQTIGWVGVGLGAIGIAVGTFALVTSPDLHKYDRGVPAEELDRELTLSVGPSGVRIAGRF